MTCFSMREILARGWGLDPDGEEFRARHRRMREDGRKRGTMTIVPAGGPCGICGDNPNLCDCEKES